MGSGSGHVEYQDVNHGKEQARNSQSPVYSQNYGEGADGLFEFYLEVFHNISTFKENIKYSEITGNMQLSYSNEAVQEKGRTQGPV